LESEKSAAAIVVFKVGWYPKMDQKVCLNMVKKDHLQLCAIALTKRNYIQSFKVLIKSNVLLKMVAIETNHDLLR